MQPYLAVPATLALVYRAYSRNSLTPLGIVVALFTAIVHSLHPWSAPFALLIVFFLGGTAVTKVRASQDQSTCSNGKRCSLDSDCEQIKHDVKARLTLSSTGASSGEGARTHIQVLANSVVASALVLLHTRQLLARDKNGDASRGCWPYGDDLLVVGIVAYAKSLPWWCWEVVY